MPRFLSVCLNPVIQKTIVLPSLKEDHVNRSDDYRTDASGKGINVTRVLHQLGADVVHLTQAGGQFRDYFLALCKNDGLKVQWVESNSEIRSCYTLLNRTQKTSTEIVEEAHPVDNKTEILIWDAFIELIKKCDFLIISGSKAAGFSDSIFPNMVKYAKELKKIVILDYRGKDLINSLPFQPDVIKPNYQEFIDTFFSGKEPTRKQFNDKLLNLGNDGILPIITNGSEEIIYVENSRIASIQPEIIQPKNTIGCGDAFTAGFSKEFFISKNLVASISTGLHCAKMNALNIRPGSIGNNIKNQ